MPRTPRRAPARPRRLLLLLCTALPLACGAPRASTPAPAATVHTLAELEAATGGLAVDREGNVYAADIGPAPERLGSTVYRITPDGRVSRFATGFVGASGNAFDAHGNLYQSNLRAHRISRITPDGQVTTFATEGIIAPVGLAFDAAGHLYVANCGSNTVRKISPDGASTHFAGGDLFNCPNGITVDDDGAVYVANFLDGRVVKVSPEGTATLFATLPGGNNGHITYHRGAFYVVDRGSHRVYRLSRTGAMEVLAGTGARGRHDGPALEATFSLPNDVAVGPGGDVLYVNEVASATGEANHPSVVRVIRLGGR